MIDLLAETHFLFLFTANLDVMSLQVPLNISFKQVGKTRVLSVLLLHSSSQYWERCGSIISTRGRHSSHAFFVLFLFTPNHCSFLRSNPARMSTSSFFIDVLLESYRSFATSFFYVFALWRYLYPMRRVPDSTRTFVRSFGMWREAICYKRFFPFH